MDDLVVKIGVEIHVQIKTKSKMFCSCKVDVTAEPNTNICPVCLGHPGVLPSPNKEAVRKAVLVAKAFESHIPERLYFSRKNYFYPDLPKGYQITQYGISVGIGGYVPAFINNEVKRFPIERINLEEETAKSFHVEKEVYLDFNRCGIPLMEIVTPPFFSSSDEVILFLKFLRKTLLFLNVSECNMEKGEFRVDTNVSVNIKEREEEGRAEIKNLNSFNAIKSAIEYEVRRQTELLKGGKHVERETRLWDEEKKETRVMRTKEFVEDYRYFPEPDIPSFEIDNRWLKEELPFLPCYYYKKFSETGASYKEMDILSSSPFFSRFCLEVFEKVPYSKAKGWIFTEILQYVEDIESLNSLPFTVSDFVDFINRVIKGEIPRHIGQEIIRRSMEENKSLREFFKDKVEIKKGEEIEDVVKEVIDENVEVVNKIKSGKVSAVSFLVGQVMRKLKGKANPKEVKEKIEEILGLN